MSALATLFTSNLVYGLAAIPVAVLLVHFVPYLLDPHGIRAYPGPFLARLSDIWLGWIAAQGHRSETVHELHKQYGTCVVPRSVGKCGEKSYASYGNRRCTIASPLSAVVENIWHATRLLQYFYAGRPFKRTDNPCHCLIITSTICSFLLSLALASKG